MAHILQCSTYSQHRRYQTRWPHLRRSSQIHSPGQVHNSKSEVNDGSSAHLIFAPLHIIGIIIIHDCLYSRQFRFDVKIDYGGQSDPESALPRLFDRRSEHDTANGKKSYRDKPSAWSFPAAVALTVPNGNISGRFKRTGRSCFCLPQLLQ